MWKRFEKLPLFPLCAAGFFLGILVCLRSGERGTLLSAENLQTLKNMTMEKNDYLHYVCKVRLGTVLLVLLAGTTYLAPFVCGALTIWFGMGMGSLLTTALMCYGIKGAVLLPVGCFPHFLVYIPAFYMLLRWCEQLFCYIYLRRDVGGLGIVLAKLLLILLAVSSGIYLESYVAPGIFQGMLKIF